MIARPISPGSALTCQRPGSQSTHTWILLADQAAQHPVEIRDDGVQVEHFRLQHLPPAEGQQLLRERGRPLAGTSGSQAPAAMAASLPASVSRRRSL